MLKSLQKGFHEVQSLHNMSIGFFNQLRLLPSYLGDSCDDLEQIKLVKQLKVGQVNFPVSENTAGSTKEAKPQQRVNIGFAFSLCSKVGNHTEVATFLLDQEDGSLLKKFWKRCSNDMSVCLTRISGQRPQHQTIKDLNAQLMHSSSQQSKSGQENEVYQDLSLISYQVKVKEKISYREVKIKVAYS